MMIRHLAYLLKKDYRIGRSFTSMANMLVSCLLINQKTFNNMDRQLL